MLQNKFRYLALSWTNKVFKWTFLLLFCWHKIPFYWFDNLCTVTKVLLSFDWLATTILPRPLRGNTLMLPWSHFILLILGWLLPQTEDIKDAQDKEGLVSAGFQPSLCIPSVAVVTVNQWESSLLSESDDMFSLICGIELLWDENGTFVTKCRARYVIQKSLEVLRAYSKVF